MASNYPKVEHDSTIFHLHGFIYQVSLDDLLEVGDYYLDFTLAKYGSHNTIEKCDSQSLANCINNNYKNTEPLKRLSAKIVATNDPTLTMYGVKEL